MTSDYAPLLLLLLAVGSGLLAALALSPKFRAHAQQLLTKQEWVATAQIFAVVFMLAALLHASIAFEFGADQFIYGRF